MALICYRFIWGLLSISRLINVVLCSSIFIKISLDLDSKPVLARFKHSIEVFCSRALANSWIPRGSAFISKLLTFYRLVRLFPSRSITRMVVFDLKSYPKEAQVSGPSWFPSNSSRSNVSFSFRLMNRSFPDMSEICFLIKLRPFKVLFFSSALSRILTYASFKPRPEIV